jgi:hypothetical protein
MKYFLILCTFLFSNAVFAFACESNYPPANMEQGTKPNIHPGVVFVEPPYAGFDPCNVSVDLKINNKSDTFIVVLHGAAGLDGAVTGIGKRFQNAGYSVLMFDAFKMNKINRDGVFWATSVHSGSTGRMIYFSAFEAIKWVLKNHPDRSRRIIVYGISTGGAAAAHLAATEGLNEIQMVWHEHPVNLAREERGEVPINSLWLYGGALGWSTTQSPTATYEGLHTTYLQGDWAAWIAALPALSEHLSTLERNTSLTLTGQQRCVVLTPARKRWWHALLPARPQPWNTWWNLPN